MRRPMDFPVTGESQEFHVLSGDTITFSQGGQNCVFLVSDIETGLELVKQDDSDDPGLMLNLGKEEFLSLFRDSPDYRIYLKDYGFTDGGGVLTVEPIEQNEMQRDEGDAPLDIGEIDTTPPSGVQSRQVDPQIIYTVNSGERYTLDIKFRSYCLLRYKKDNDEAVQKYYKEGDTLMVEVNNRIALWLSNAGAVYAKVNSHELDLGDPGQVAAKRIQWAKTPTGQYELLLLNVY